MDYGVQGMEESLDIFERLGIDIIGEEGILMRQLNLILNL